MKLDFSTGFLNPFCKALVLARMAWVPVVICFSELSCTKMVKIPEPLNTITTSETFSTAANANSAIAGIYNNMLSTTTLVGSASIYPSMSADDLNASGGPNIFQTNTLQAGSGASDNFWTGPYYNIYQANAAIEGLQASASLSLDLKTRLTGEAKFLRAFCFFYLVNYFGDVPLTLTTSYANNDLLPRAAVADVYKQIVKDLQDAQSALPGDYSAGNGERIRANSWAATALLARTYLYMGKWDSAEIQSTRVLNNTQLFSLVADLDSAFLKNNNESILQLQQNYINGINSAATIEGFLFIPYDPSSPPNFYLTDELLNAFEPNDLRRVHWVDSLDFNDGITTTTYYYPYKYKVQTTTADNITEYSVMLRLAEQYLIRAEARAMQNIDLVGAIDDLNQVRTRAGLAALPNSYTQPQVLAAIAQERRVEFFAEFSHRWFDLKRTNQANTILGLVKPLWKPTAVLYPIPYNEIQTDPNLKQNPGYLF